jgi:hypothetical protein
MSGVSASAPRRVRVAAASRDDVLALAMHRYLRGRRVDDVDRLREVKAAILGVTGDPNGEAS